MYAAAFRFGATLISEGEMTPTSVYRYSLDTERYMGVKNTICSGILLFKLSYLYRRLGQSSTPYFIFPERTFLTNILFYDHTGYNHPTKI